MRGRKPKPNALRKLDGNAGKRKLNKEPNLPKDMPECPAELSPAARAEWNRLAGIMHQAGLLTEVDRVAFAIYCEAWAAWLNAIQKLQETGPILKGPKAGFMHNPYLGVQNKQAEILRQIMSEFGLTPSSRSRIKVGTILPGGAAPSSPSGQPGDPFEEEFGAPPAVAGRIGA